MNLPKNRYIGLAGVMGSGKTTASKILSKELGFPLLEEKPEENPFLEDFYKDMKRWILHADIFFVLNKVQQNAAAQQLLKNTSVIHDAPPGQDMVYVRANQKLGNLTNNEYKLIKRIAELHKPNIILPDLLICLEAPIDLIMERIAGRGRGYEQKVPRDYIAALIKFQKNWIACYPKNKKIVIPMDKIDLKEKRHRDAFVKLIRDRLQ